MIGPGPAADAAQSQGNVTQDQVVRAAKQLGALEFTRAELADQLGVDRSELKDGFRAARESGRVERVGAGGVSGAYRFRLRDW